MSTRTADDVLASVRRAFADVAPDVDLGAVDPHVDLLAEADLDSMDFLNIITALDTDLGVAVPERDYPRVRTLAGLVEYLVAHS